uniref:beta-N-acetylhexosaminidase n=1 Tax=Riptortus pedestris TaxID=329032 RepID=R4WDD9_RIPPE|nr:beta-hexosaminidase [Riptortus pedestris]
MGGDEVHLGCWNQSQEIVDYMKTKGYPRTVDGFIRLWSEFHSRALDAWDKAVGHKNTKIILWTSDLTNPFAIEDSLDKSRFIIEAWTDQYDRVPSELLRLGYEVIFATTDTWYLDHGFWGRTKYHSWKEVYDYKIPEDPKVLGGEAPLWTEYVDTNSIDTRIWPRAAALAERLWASPSTSAVDAEYRLLEMRQRLIRRGIQVEQIVPQWCYLNEGLCKL